MFLTFRLAVVSAVHVATTTAAAESSFLFHDEHGAFGELDDAVGAAADQAFVKR
jgi:hypothetical protein